MPMLKLFLSLESPLRTLVQREIDDVFCKSFELLASQLSSCYNCLNFCFEIFCEKMQMHQNIILKA